MPTDFDPPQPQRPLSPVDGLRAAPPATRIGFRRTIVPILCTLALLLPGLAIWLGRVDVDSPFAGHSGWVRLTLVAAGVVSAVLAVLNMVQLRQILRR